MIQEIKKENFRREYGILCHRFYPVANSYTPFGSSWCEVEPGKSTAPHNHPDGETFIVIRGAGRMQVGPEIREVKAGDVVYIPSKTDHELVNLSQTDPLEFISVWWDPPKQNSDLPERSLVIVAPPTPNGDLHLGHLSGPYLASDIYRRFLEMSGSQVHFLSGSDDNQSYVPAKGRLLSLTPEEVVEKFSTAVQDTLKAADIRVTEFLRPTKDDAYMESVQAFFQRLVKKGAVKRENTDILYCTTCDRQIFEAYASGTCPHCMHGTNAHGCEQCGLINDAVDLIDPKCNLCKGRPEIQKAERYVFSLEDYRPQLSAYYDRVQVNPRLRAFTQRLLSKPLPKISVSFESTWGIPVAPDSATEVIYEWLEMAAGYRFVADKLALSQDWNPLSASAKHEAVLFFGFDNSFFYSALVPALLIAENPEVRLPRALVTNEFYRLEGLKFSTSRNHAIWGREILDTVNRDVVRYFLSYDRPEEEQTNFQLDSLREIVDRELVGQWDSWIHELNARSKELGGKTKRAAVSDENHLHFLENLRRLAADIDRHYRAEHFSPREVTRSLNEIVRQSRRFARGQEFHRQHRDRHSLWAESISLELSALNLLAMASAPIMPDFSASLLASLNRPQLRWSPEIHLFGDGTEIHELGKTPFLQALSDVSAFTQKRRLASVR